MDATLLRSCPLFGGVSDAAVERILASSAERVAAQGEVLALPNDPGSGMFVIEEGTVAVELRSGSIELGPGDFFGELALLVDDGARVARVRATSPVRCISVLNSRTIGFYWLMKSSCSLSTCSSMRFKARARTRILVQSNN
jgi:CRP-like cAMP-binding protein